ncbi:MAG: hypothetical protein V2J19_06630 [Wenzhouxiangella sp.]|jgi:hypothetical protein|nr:hypothetical protein [Wenzhouxiangella sp.]
MKIHKVVMSAAAVLIVAACASSSEKSDQRYQTQRTVYDERGSVRDSVVESGGQVISELRRQFDETTLTGEGRIKNSNEGLARRAATQLAVSELAAKVETEVRANTRIYNNSEVRDIVETRVAALVQDYEIDYAGYESDAETYLVRVSITGRRLTEEFERQLVNR